MWSKITVWLKKSWGFFVGVVSVLIATLAAATELVEFIGNRRLTPPAVVLTNTPWSIFTPTLSPTPIPPTPTIGPFLFLVLPTQTKAGEDVKVSVQAWPGAACYLAYYTPSGGMSSARGLGPTVADSLGRCTWEWHISANTSLGVGKLVISINGVQETHEIEILPGD